MMKRAIFFFLLASLAGAQTPAVTSVYQTLDWITGAPVLSHGTVQISFTSTNWTNSSSPASRVRWTVAPATCTSMTGGTTSGFQTPPTINPAEMVVGGLTPNTTYNICPEISGDGGQTWHGGVAVNITTLPLPAVHPVPPTSPTTFNTSYPNTAGYTTVTLAPDCHDIWTQYATAVTNRAAHGTIIYLPLGTACTAQLLDYSNIIPLDPDANTFVSSSSTVSTTNNTITLPTAVAEGAQIVFGVSGDGRLPGSGGVQNAGPLISGQTVYYWHVVSGNTGQVYIAAPYPSGKLVALSNIPNNVYGQPTTISYVTLPRSPNWIIFRTPTPDSQFVPEHSRVEGPPTTDGITQDVYPSPPTQWAPFMAEIQIPYSIIANQHSLIEFDAGDEAVNPMPTNVRFEGIKFDHGPDPYEYISSDPLPWFNWFTTSAETENVVFDRCWFHSSGTPERLYSGFYWNGHNMAIVDSYFDGMHYFHAAMTGLGISGTTGGHSATIATGFAGFGAGHGSITTKATISWTGAPTVASNHRAFVYFPMTGNVLNFAFPPGVSPTITGPSNYHVVSLAGYGISAGPGRYNAGTTSLTFPTTNEPDNYYIDPVVSNSATCSSTNSLFANLNTAATPAASTSSSFDLSLTFTNDTAQYLCGLRFFKLSAETPTTHTLDLWSTSGSVLASTATSNETASGWQTAMLTTPYPMSAATQYVIGYHTTNAAATGHLQFQNADYYNANMHVSGAYIDSNGSGNGTDALPRFVPEINGYEGPAAGYIAYIDLNSSGVINDVGNADMQSTFVNSHPSSEGCQCMIGGIGPGPYVSLDNYREGTGNVWHYDNSGGTWDPGRADYTHYRDYWRMPAYTWLTGPYSDGMRYCSRHHLEWKDGKHISIKGNIFNRWYTDMTPTDEPFEISAKDGQTTSDLYIGYNSMFHGPGGPLLGVQEATAGGPAFEPEPNFRSIVEQNLAWDIDGQHYCVQNAGFVCPTAGWWMDNTPTMEDSRIDHNTVLLNSGGNVPVFIYTQDQPAEGMVITNNFMIAEGSKYSFSWYDNGPNDSCHGIDHGEALANCKFTPSYVWSNNVFLGTSVTASQIEGVWPNHLNNYFTSTNGPSLAGFFNPSGWNFGNGGSNAVPNLRLKNSAPFQSGSAYVPQTSGSGTDLRSVGADVDAVEAAQGVVHLISETATGTSTASITVVQPDSGTCTLDYGTEPTVTTFTRVSQACTPGSVTFNLTGLTTGTLYYFRYDGAVQQPMGQFKTH